MQYNLSIHNLAKRLPDYQLLNMLDCECLVGSGMPENSNFEEGRGVDHWVQGEHYQNT